MADTVFACNVYEQTDGAPERTGRGRRKFNELQAHFRKFLRRFQRLAAMDDVRLDLRAFRWPAQFDEQGLFAESSAYTFLDTPIYKHADFAVCCIDSVQKSGPELAHLLSGRERPPQHLFIVTRAKITSEVDQELLSIADIPQVAIPQGSLLIPEVLNADNRLSFFDLQSMFSDEATGRMREILYS